MWHERGSTLKIEIHLRPNFDGCKVYAELDGEPGTLHTTRGELSNVLSAILDPSSWFWEPQNYLEEEAST